jgi:hypothetical protein
VGWTAPRTWVAAETVTAALLNTHVRDNLNAITTAAAFTPAWSNITVGNGTSAGSFISAGKLVFFQASLTFGSTTSVTGAIGLNSLTTSNTFGVAPGVQATCFDTSATQFYAGVAFNVSASAITIATLASPIVAWSATVPVTWATGDVLSVTGWYFAA